MQPQHSYPSRPPRRPPAPAVNPIHAEEHIFPQLPRFPERALLAAFGSMTALRARALRRSHERWWHSRAGRRAHVACQAAEATTVEPPTVGETEETTDNPPEKRLELWEEDKWQEKLRLSYRLEEWESVARITMAMGGNKVVLDELICTLAQEVLGGSASKFGFLMHYLEDNDIQPSHLVQLYHLVEVWFRQQVPTHEQWSGVLRALVAAEEDDEALELFRGLETGDDKRLPEPVEETYAAVAPLLGRRRGQLSSAALGARMSLRAAEPKAIFYGRMVVIACKAPAEPDLEMAKRWVAKAEERWLLYNKYLTEEDANYGEIVRPYNSLMAGYMRLGRVKDAFTLIGCMRRKGIKPDRFSFHSLMISCIRYSDFGTQECRQLLRVMQQMGTEPDTANYNQLLQAYSLSGQLTSALNVANKMREAGIRWDRRTYYHLLSAVITGGQVELSLRLLAKMRKDGVRPTASHYTLAFSGLARAGFYEDAARVFRRLASLPGLATDFAYNMMIGTHCKRGDMVSAVEVQQEMEERGFQSNIMTYRMLLEGYAFQQQWAAMLALHKPVSALRAKVVAQSQDPGTTQAAREEAEAALPNGREILSWTKAYHLMIDAAVWSGEWTRAVELLEESVECGLPPKQVKHAKLLQATKDSVRFTQGIAESTLEQREEQRERRDARVKWVETLPSTLQATRTDSRLGAEPEGQLYGGVSRLLSLRRNPQPRRLETEEEDEKVTIAPPHIVCASFSPNWLDGAKPGGGGSSEEVLEKCLGGEQISAEEAYRVVHDYHHATVHRRPLATLHLESSAALVGRAVVDTAHSLRELFASLGEPGSSTALTYVFLRPADCTLDGLLTLLAVAAVHPQSVLLLRTRGDPETMRGLAKECTERGDRALGFCLASLLVRLPAAVLVNSQVLIANATDVAAGTPQAFEESLRQSLRGNGGVNIGSSAGAAVKEWPAWLRSQHIGRLVRCEKGTIRLDGATQRPVQSTGEVFRARGMDNGQVLVDLWSEEEGLKAY